MKVICGSCILLLAVVALGAVSASAQSENSEYVVVANKQQQGSTISMAALKGIYLREVRSWGSGGAIVPVDLTTAGTFYQNLFGKNYVQMQAYWLSMRVKQNADLPVSKKDADSVKQYISENKGAIGFLKSGDVDDRVKVLKVVE